MMSDDSRVQEVLDESRRRLEESAESEVRSFYEHRVSLGVDSPIERLFLAAMATLVLRRHFSFSHQVQIGRYRVDFVVTGGESLSHLILPVRVVVECDGHEFHEKTKGQAEHDKKRDRFLTAQGYAVMRFTGRELWRDPFACVDEVSHYVNMSILERMDAFASLRKSMGEVKDA